MGGGHPNCVLYLDNDYKRHFGSDHMPVVDVVFILLRVPGRVAEISIPKKKKNVRWKYFCREPRAAMSASYLQVVMLYGALSGLL